MALAKNNLLPLRFERVRIDKIGKPYSGRYFTVIKAADKEQLNPRFAILVSKKISLLATDRNFLRRRVSSIIQDVLPTVYPADYLIIPKKNSLGTNIDDLKTDLNKLFHD